ncbi:hypothetical protein BD310DRAFT_926135 [Dichomitus squalens]|uniref:Uncharacterized protein n=1 Tax=Dichomitus squalens TaxID=114155 RepID=A0A4V2K874_9APHY|nr:hypothetical protein BD310DRAFT_926135 [Dichomitus squalens]
MSHRAMSRIQANASWLASSFAGQIVTPAQAVAPHLSVDDSLPCGRVLCAMYCQRNNISSIAGEYEAPQPCSGSLSHPSCTSELAASPGRYDAGC